MQDHQALEPTETEPGQLVPQLTAARQLLDEARTAEDFLKARFTSIGLQHLLKASSAAFDLQQAAMEIRVRAERALGNALLQVERSKGGRPPENSLHAENSFHAETSLQESISSLGINSTEAWRWQEYAKIPDARLSGFFEDCKLTHREITSKALLHLAKPVWPSDTTDGETDRQPGKTLRFWVTGNGQVDVAQQAETIIRAVGEAYTACTDQPFPDQENRKVYPGYYLYLIAADYLAGRGIAVEE